MREMFCIRGSTRPSAIALSTGGGALRDLFTYHFIRSVRVVFVAAGTCWVDFGRSLMLGPRAPRYRAGPVMVAAATSLRFAPINRSCRDSVSVRAEID